MRYIDGLSLVFGPVLIGLAVLVSISYALDWIGLWRILGLLIICGWLALYRRNVNQRKAKYAACEANIDALEPELMPQFFMDWGATRSGIRAAIAGGPPCQEAARHPSREVMTPERRGLTVAKDMIVVADVCDRRRVDGLLYSE